MKQTLALFFVGLRLLLARPGPGMIIVVGMAGLTAVAVSLSVIAGAFEQTLKGTGEADRALVLRAGSTSEINGNVPLAQYALVQNLPEVARRDGVGLASRETYVTVNMPQRQGDNDATLPMRGVMQGSFDVRAEVTLVAGKPFTPGRYELIAGVRAAELFAGMTPGNSVSIRGQQWGVTGIFSAGGSAYESEIWVDERLLAQSWGRGETFSSMLVQLRNAADFEVFRERIAGDPRLTMAAQRESDYYSNQAASTSGLIRGLGWLVGSIMALGAVFSAFNTMQSALDARIREIATLRVLGFGRAPLLGAILMECVLLSLVGAGVGFGGVYALLNGATLSTVAASTTSNAQVAFQFSVTPGALALAATLALTLGLLGGLVPGTGAVRRYLPGALRGA